MNTTRTKKANRRQYFKTSPIQWCNAEPDGYFQETTGYNRRGVVNAFFRHNFMPDLLPLYAKAARNLGIRLYVSKDAYSLPDEETGRVYSLKGSYYSMFFPFGNISYRDFSLEMDRLGFRECIRTRLYKWFFTGFKFPFQPPKGIPGMTKIRYYLGMYGQNTQNSKTKRAVSLQDEITTARKIKKANLTRRS